VPLGAGAGRRGGRAAVPDRVLSASRAPPRVGLFQVL
jgi:hypothetical protein